MLTPLNKNFTGLITISGATKSGKSQLAEFLIQEQESITYIATSKPRENDLEWQLRIDAHRSRRPPSWKLIEHPVDICKTLESIDSSESILVDSLGGLVEQHLLDNEYQWGIFQNKFIKCLIKQNFGIIIVAEEIGWGVVPATPTGHLYRERHCKFLSLLCRHSIRKWLAVNGSAIDLNKIGFQIP